MISTLFPLMMSEEGCDTLQQGLPDPDRMIALLQKLTGEALTEGYGALRVTSEMMWPARDRAGKARLVECEARLNDFLLGSRCLVLCQYDRRCHDAQILLDALRTHPIAVVEAVRYDNCYYIPPDELLGPDLPQAKLRHWLRNLAKHREAEEALRKQAHDLNERIKELHCLFAISDLVEQPGISLEAILQGVVDLIPPAWQYPEVACSRISLEGRSFETQSFRESPWKQASDVVVQGERLGVLEVCYREAKPQGDEGPFSREERRLLNAIAERVGRII